jgi:hypothetical protein
MRSSLAYVNIFWIGSRNQRVLIRLYLLPVTLGRKSFGHDV